MKEANRNNPYNYVKRRHRGFRMRVLAESVDQDFINLCCDTNQEGPQDSNRLL